MSRKTVLAALLVGVALLVIGMAVSAQLGQGRTEAPVPAAFAGNSTPVTAALDAQTFRRIAEAQMPMVVNIRSESRRQTRDLSEFFGGGDDSFRRFFGLPDTSPAPREELTEGAGSGFVIDKAGLILTNNHVVAGASRIEVGLFAGTPGNPAGKTYDAKVVGRDPLTDSALIRLVERPSFDLPVAAFGDSKQMAPGDIVVAIGNPFNLAHTVTVGVISAKERPFQALEGRVQEMLQTDAAINPGNSGGPLLNLRGEVVGINSAILSTSPTAGNVGIGFAVPINAVRELLPQLEEGKVTRGRIGVQVTSVPDDAVDELGLDSRRGALVAAVDREGPAARAGIQPGDVILEYDGKPIQSSDTLVRMVVNTKPGSTVPVQLLRDRKPMTVNVRVEALDLAGMDPETGTSNDRLEGFGLSLGPLTPEIARQLRLPQDRTGAVVMNVTPGSPAARSGLRPGDVIVQINRKDAAGVDEAIAELRRVPPGGTALLLVLRGSEEVFLTVTKAKEP